MSEYKQPPPPYSAEPPPTGASAPYGFNVPPMPQAPQAYGPTVQQPLPGYYPQPHQGTTTTINIPPATQVVLINGCPNCRAGVLEEEYSCCGIFCAIFFFPLGVLCCLLTRERRCTNCRATF